MKHIKLELQKLWHAHPRQNMLFYLYIYVAYVNFSTADRSVEKEHTISPQCRVFEETCITTRMVIVVWNSDIVDRYTFIKQSYDRNHIKPPNA